MKKDEIFFGAQGLTSTSANHIANVAKELYTSIEKELSNVRFYNSYMSLIGTDKKDLISSGLSSVSDLNEKLERVAKLKSLIAWLREAISAKQRLTKEAELKSLKQTALRSVQALKIVIPDNLKPIYEEVSAQGK